MVSCSTVPLRGLHDSGLRVGISGVSITIRNNSEERHEPATSSVRHRSSRPATTIPRVWATSNTAMLEKSLKLVPSYEDVRSPGSVRAAPMSNGQRTSGRQGFGTPMFDLPNAYRVRLEKLWVDELVYASSGRKDVSEKVKDLRLKMIWVSPNAT
ncbi:hypothetical protein BC827DRAFT_1174520 [Russula dissimulans]|nr:hypothetical protein BC827DRAFT_1174520 [Russula dissimulans]